MRVRLVTIVVVSVFAGVAVADGGLWRIVGAVLLFLSGLVAVDLDRLHREHIETALTLSASSSIGQLRNRLAHERRQRSGRR